MWQSITCSQQTWSPIGITENKSMNQSQILLICWLQWDDSSLTFTMQVFKKLFLTLDPSEQRRLKIAILSTTQSLQWCDSRKGFVAWITKHESHACSIMSSVNINNFANQPRTVDATPNYWRYNDTGVSQLVAWVSLFHRPNYVELNDIVWNWTTWLG